MNASSSGVAISAAKIRSPSFSRSSSSTTTTGRPAAMSAIARSIPAMSGLLTGCLLRTGGQMRRGEFLHVLRQHVHLEVDQITRLAHAERGQLQRGRDQADGKFPGA